MAERSEAERGLVIVTYACSRVAVSVPKTSNVRQGFGPRATPPKFVTRDLTGRE